MDKSPVCKNATPTKAVNPQQTKQMVYESSSGHSKARKSGSHKLPIIKVMKPKKIIVCSSAEMKKMCRPPPCPCPPKDECMTLFRVVCRSLGFAVKSFIAGSLIYYTWDAGLWGSSEDTEMLYAKICRYFAKESPNPQLSTSCEAEMELMDDAAVSEDLCLRPPIDRERIAQSVKERWNSGVTFMFEGLVGFPYNAIAYVNNFWQPEACTKTKSK